MAALCPVRVRHRQPFSQELYVEGIEIKLEIACDLHLAPGQARCDPFRRAFQEAALGDIEHRPHQQDRSEEHTSELQSLMRISYAVFCLKKKKNNITTI